VAWVEWAACQKVIKMTNSINGNILIAKLNSREDYDPVLVNSIVWEAAKEYNADHARFFSKEKMTRYWAEEHTGPHIPQTAPPLIHVYGNPPNFLGFMGRLPGCRNVGERAGLITRIESGNPVSKSPEDVNKVFECTMSISNKLKTDRRKGIPKQSDLYVIFDDNERFFTFEGFVKKISKEGNEMWKRIEKSLGDRSLRTSLGPF